MNPVRSFTLLFLFLVLLASPGLANDDFKGPSFSDPDHRVTMPPGWLEQNIIYDKDVADADLVVNLDQSQHSLFAPVIKEYAAKNNLNIFVNSGTCGISSRMLMNKEADLTSFCCPPGNTDRLPGLKFYTMGISPLGLIVNPQNPIRNITLNEARKAFMGEVHRWSELSHDSKASQYDHPIHPIAFIHCKKRPGHWRLILDNEELFSTRMKNVVTVPEMIQTVATNPMALGYEIPGLAEHYTKEQDNEVAFLHIDGMDPLELNNLVSGAYPFYRTYNFTIWDKNNNPHVGDLLKYLIDFVEEEGPKHRVVPASWLRKAGWKFHDNELVGEVK